jgi:hypothetical protein
MVNKNENLKKQNNPERLEHKDSSSGVVVKQVTKSNKEISKCEVDQEIKKKREIMNG